MDDLPDIQQELYICNTGRRVCDGAGVENGKAEV